MSQQPPFPPNNNQPPNQGGPYQPQQPGQYPPQGGYPPQQGQWQQPPPGYQYPPQQQGYYPGPPQPPQKPPRNDKVKGLPVWAWVGGGFVVILIIAGIVGTISKGSTAIATPTAVAAAAKASPTSVLATLTKASDIFVDATVPATVNTTVAATSQPTTRPTNTRQATATQRPTIAPTTAASGLFQATPAPASTQSNSNAAPYASGGLGLLKTDWEKRHGTRDPKFGDGSELGKPAVYEGKTYLVTFDKNNKVWWIDVQFPDNKPASFEEARAFLKNLIPADSQFLKTYQTDKGDTADLYSSESLKTQLPPTNADPKVPTYPYIGHGNVVGQFGATFTEENGKVIGFNLAPFVDDEAE